MRCNQPKTPFGWFSAKNKDGHCVFACCAGSGLAQSAKHVLLEGVGDIALFLFSTYALEKMEDLCRLLFISWVFARLIVLLVLPVIYWTWKVLHWFPWYELSKKIYIRFWCFCDIGDYPNESTLVLVCFGWFWCCSVLFFVDFGQNPHALFMRFLCAFKKRIKSAYTFLKSVYTFCAFFKGAEKAHKKCIKSA